MKRCLSLAAVVTCLIPTAANAQKSLDPATLKAVKQSTVFLKVRLPDNKLAFGSGFFAFEPGLLLTNAHVVGMLSPDGRKPQQVDVTLNSGEAGSRTVR